MRILVIDKFGSSLNWTRRCIADGHKVKWYVPADDKVALVGKGIVERVADPREWYRWADLIFFTDNTKWLHEADAWRANGWPVISAGVEGAKWEVLRDVGQKVFKDAGIKVADSKMFTTYDPAIAYVKREMRRFVSKPCGDEENKALSYCSKSPADMVYMLERWKRNKTLAGSFILQEFTSGTEMAVGGWFGPGGFNQGWCENWEFKKLMNGDLGVATGEQGTVVRHVAKSLLADKVLKPIESALEKINYVGYIDVNCIIDDHGVPMPLEFTMRPGWPLFNIQQAVQKGDHAEWLMQLYEGKDARNFELDKVIVGVVMSIPDYPYSHFTRKEVNGVPLYGMTKSIEQSVHPCEMMMGEAPVEVDGKIINQPILCSAGDYVLVTTGTGETISEAKKGAYRVLKKLSMPNSPMYRTDIGDRLKKQLPAIQAMGYAANLKF